VIFLANLFSSAARRVKAAVLWHTKRFEPIKTAMIGHAGYAGDKARGNIRSIKKFGKVFLTTFPPRIIPGKKRSRFVISIVGTYGESPAALAITVESTAKRQRGVIEPFRVGEASLLFEKDSVVIGDLQGEKKSEKHLSRFRTVTGKLWADHLFDAIEEHARKCGFKEVKFSTPEKTRPYTNPSVAKGFPEDMANRKEQIRMRMRKLYYGIANARGYKKIGDFFVKNL
jgi:hypothetical protein